MIAGVEIRVAGEALEESLAANLLEVRVDDNLMLPDAFMIRLADPGMTAIDSDPLPFGADVEILLAPPDREGLVTVVSGQIAAIEPAFGSHGVEIVGRGYDHSHNLNRTQVTQTYQNMTADDIARKVVSRTPGFEQGTIDSSGEVYEFIQQNNETDWLFLWRLARRIDFEVVVSGRQVHFRHAGGGDSDPIKLTWGDNLLGFRPRVTGVQQVRDVVVRGWDPATKDVIESRAKVQSLGVEIGIDRGDVVSALGGGTVTVADRPVMSTREADAFAESLAAELGNAFAEAEGTCRGDPRLRAGAKTQIDGVGQRFGGTYTLSATTHLFRGRHGYETRITIGGRSPRHLVDLMTPATARSWGNSVVVGVVSQNDDPDGLGRVRVKYPVLGDQVESWWARVATASAGEQRGLLMMPIVGDEVVVAFEHDDVRRPYVLGSVWNAKQRPGDDLVQTDGSFALRSDQQVQITAGDVITIKTDKDLTAETGGQVHVSAQNSITLEASGNLTIKAASLTLEATGQVQISGSQISLG